MAKIKLGDKVKDTLTDLEGTVTARTEYLYGCVQIEVQPKELKDGKIVEAPWIDEPQLIKLTPVKKKIQLKRTYGGIRNHPR